MADPQPIMNVAEQQAKPGFVKAVQAQTTSLAVAWEEYLSLRGVYFDRGYNTGGADPITDEDLGGVNFDIEDLNMIINMIEQLNNFMTGLATTPDSWKTPVNKVRGDV